MKKLTNRLLSWLLVICMLMSMTVTTAFALEGNAFQSTATQVSGDDTFVVSFTQPTDVTVATLSLKIEFDKTAFEIIEEGITAKYADAPLPDVTGCNTAGNIQIAYTDNTYAAATSISSGTTLLSVTFKIKEGATVGNKTFSVTDYKLSGGTADEYGQFQDVTPSYGSSTLSVEIVEESAGGDEGDSTTGYTASVSAATTTVNNDGTASNVTVNVVVNKAFNSAELKLSYDKERLKYEGYTLAEGQSLPDGDPIEVNGADGIITIRDYGAGYAAGNAYTLTFTSTKGGVANVAVTSAGFSTEEEAETKDLITATTGSSASVTINHKVTITDSDTNTTTYAYVTPGQGYNFQIPNYSTYYNYTVNVNGGTKTDNGSGSYTISDITDAVTITYSKAAITYEVTWTDTESLIEDTEQKSPVNAGEDIVFYLPKNVAAVGIVDGTNYLVTVTRGETTITPTYTTEGEKQKVVIAGTDVIGALTIVAYSETASAAETTLTIDGSNKIEYNGNAVSGTINVPKKENITLTLQKEIGYTYKVEQFVGGATTGTELTVDANGNFTVNVGTQPITIKVTETLDTSNLEVEQYVSLSGKTMWLVTVKTTQINGKTYHYSGTDNVNGENFYWSSKYNSGSGAYCFLVVEDANTAKETVKSNIASKLTLVDGAATAISYDGNVNLTFKNPVAVIDVNDAQLVWNMYSAVYSGITQNVTVQKFLEADMDNTVGLDTTDAAQVVALIPAN